MALDHSDGLNWVRDQFGAQVWLHPWVSEPLVDRNVMDVPCRDENDGLKIEYKTEINKKSKILYFTNTRKLF